MKTYNYAREKLFGAIANLALGPGDIRSRLWDAYTEMHPLREDDFPEELRADWHWIDTQLTKYEPRNEYEREIGQVQTTLMRIKRKTGVKIAERIYYLYEQICSGDKYD